MIILWGNCLGTRWKTSGTAGWKPQRNQIIEVPSLIGLMSLNYWKVDLWLHFGKSNLEFRRRKEKIQIPWRNYCHNGNPISHLLLYNTSPQNQVTSIAADMYYSHSMSGIWEQLGHRLVSPNGIVKMWSGTAVIQRLQSGRRTHTWEVGLTLGRIFLFLVTLTSPKGSWVPSQLDDWLPSDSWQ